MSVAAVRTVQYARPWLYEKQERAIFCPERYSIIEATTKAGKTVGCIAWAIEQAIGLKPGQAVWWVAPVYPQAEIAFRRTARAVREGLPKDYYNVNRSHLTIEFVGAGTIWFKSGEVPDNLFGEDTFAAIVDEASRVREEAWHALRSTLTATRGPVRIIGNVKGRKNWFYRLARKAEAGEPGMKYAKIIAADAVAAGVLNAEEIEDARRQLPDSVFRELYLAEPSDDEGNPFGLSAIRACVVEPWKPAKPDDKPPVPVAYGWDLAKSVDWTWGIGLDVNGYVAYSERWQSPWNDTIQRIKATTGNVPALVDSTGVGDPVLEQLQKGGNFEGYKFTGPSKQQLMEGLAVAIQQRQISFSDDRLVGELESFEYVYSRTGCHYSAPDGSNDDGVCALALAVHAYKNKSKNTPATMSTIPFFGV